MAPVGRVKKPARPGDLNLGAGVPLGKAFGGKSGNGLEDRQCSRHGVKAVAAHAAPLLVGEVEDIQGRMKAEVTRPQGFLRFHYRRRVGGDLARVLVELELPDLVRAVSRDVRNESVAVGRVGLHRVSPGRRFQRYDWGSSK